MSLMRKIGAILFAIILGIGIKSYSQDTLMYKGGYADGYAHAQKVNFLYKHLSKNGPYMGGAADGYASDADFNFYPDALNQYSMYLGGMEDGYSTGEQNSFYPGFLHHFAMYTADVTRGDGYASMEYHTYDHKFLDHYMAYTSSGTGDGYAGYLVMGYHNPLPLELILFEGEKINEYSLLKWVVADEQDVLEYELQKSENGFKFNTIYSVKVTSPSYTKVNYEYRDEQPFNGPNLYRLMIKGKNGKITYSQTVLITFMNGMESIVLFPNPVKNDLQVKYELKQNTHVRMIDIKGVAIYSQLLHLGSNQISIPIHHLASGSYLMEFMSENGEKRVIKFVKE